jgi:hypothetical protein
MICEASVDSSDADTAEWTDASDHLV